MKKGLTSPFGMDLLTSPNLGASEQKKRMANYCCCLSANESPRKRLQSINIKRENVASEL